MDNSHQHPPTPGVGPAARRVQLFPDRRFTAAAAAGFLVAVGIAIVTDDPLGRVLVLVGAVLLGCYVVGDLVFAPRVEAGPDGVVLRSPFNRVYLHWDEIDSIEVVTRLRLGVRNAALEVDAGAVLAEFSRRALGMTPEHALSQILACRPPQP